MKRLLAWSVVVVAAGFAALIIRRGVPAGDQARTAAQLARVVAGIAITVDEQIDDRFFAGERSTRSQEGWSPDDFFVEVDEIRAADAIATRNQSQLQQLIDEGLDPNTTGYGGITLLYWSFACGNLDAFRLLLENGADPDRRLVDAVKSRDGGFAPGDSILFTALRRSKMQFFFTALQYTRDTRQLDSAGNTLLHVSVAVPERVTEEQLQRIIDSGVDLNAKDQYGSTAALTALGWHRPKLSLMLLKAGADPDAADAYGRTISDKLPFVIDGYRRLGNERFLGDVETLQQWLASRQ